MLLRAARKKWQEHKVSGSSETVLSLSLSEGNGNPLQEEIDRKLSFFYQKWASAADRKPVSIPLSLTEPSVN